MEYNPGGGLVSFQCLAVGRQIQTCFLKTSHCKFSDDDGGGGGGE